MVDILNSYLIQHKSLNIPGIGTLFVEKLPAKTDFVNRQLFPPEYRFSFDKHFDAPDKDFFNYLAARKNIPDYDAMLLYNQFASELRARLKQEDRAEWKEFGTFKKDESGELVFEQIVPKHSVYAPVIAERVIRTNSSHAILVGDREKTNLEMTEFLSVGNKTVFADNKSWKIYALVLAVIALVFLLFYFSTHGFNWQSAANQQRIELKPATR